MIMETPIPLPPRHAPSFSPASRRRRLWWRITCVALLLFGLAVLYAVWPRTASLRDFDPDEVARLDARAWRHYYEKKYARLTNDLYRLCRRQLGASPARSLQIGWYAARAASIFQKSKSRDQAWAALPYLEKYYGVISAASEETFSIKDAARLELEWWQQRREHVAPEGYAHPMAECASVLYGVENDEIRQSSVVRSQTMAWRDAHRGKAMTDADWLHIEQQLRLAARLLHAGVQRTP